MIVGGCVLLMVAGLSFVLGAAAGTGISFEQFKTLLVPLLDAAGGWVSGIGALAAVVTSLWLADRQRREDVEHLDVLPQLSIIPGLGWMISIHVVSDGRRPATVTSIVIGSKHATVELHLLSFYHKNKDLPASLQYGESLDLIGAISLRAELVDYVAKYCGGKFDGLVVRVRTTTSHFSGEIEGNVLPYLRGEYD
ncbi:hypothetical protein F3I16_16015 [Pseudomonas sp. L-22-4S-12]|uniref:hypothetical protein n=1 Tax=Pseudomonas sp. L-22-4S-12 TaxID=2610893 RepID=UPI001322FECB|nr:hypothetical protein [Pseudomonas sp. L-22-4S-12]MWV17548.1 hypothetical protein [Pseudomonas sp. L-22-4S-12]